MFYSFTCFLLLRDIRIDTFYGGVRFDNFNQNVGHDAAVPWADLDPELERGE